MYTLITGSTGFLGKNLIYELQKENRKIKCLVRKNSDCSLLDEMGVEKVEGDVRDLESIKRSIKDVDVIYHLAGKANPSIVYDYSYYEEVNVKGTKNILEAVKSNKNIKKVLVMSSIAATGPSRDGRLLDEKSKLRPITLYGKSKVEVEKLCKKYFDEYKVPVVVIRAPMVYGIYDTGWINFFKLIRYYIKQDKKLPIPGKHKNLFDFCYVGNLVHGLVQAEESNNTSGEIYFLTDNKSYTIEEILVEVTKKFKIKYPTKLRNKYSLFFEAYLGEIKGRIIKKDPFISTRDVKWMTRNYWVCNCLKAKKDFNYNPYISLEEGINKTIDWAIKMKIL